VILIHGAGTPNAELEHVPLYEMDHSHTIDHLTSLYVPPLPRAGSFERFQETIAHLRAPEGCPWDRKQTHQSLREFLLEETYEVLEALDNDDTDALREELGDLLLQIVLHTQIAIEAGEFQMADVLATVNTKMIERHPHVWGDVDVSSADEVVANWDAIKRKQKAESAKTNGKTSILDGIAKGLPALAQAQSYQARAARVGFDWPQIDGVLDKLKEELAELYSAQAPEERQEEIGDVLFSVVNLARWYEIDPEAALRATNRKFVRRFQYIEQHAERDLKEMTLQEMDALWDEAKTEG
jgi:tetrapyrrole methylase family protein/MazG family protein